jgi:hypothetical protein
MCVCECVCVCVYVYVYVYFKDVIFIVIDSLKKASNNFILRLNSIMLLKISFYS